MVTCYFFGTCFVYALFTSRLQAQTSSNSCPTQEGAERRFSSPHSRSQRRQGEQVLAIVDSVVVAFAGLAIHDRKLFTSSLQVSHWCSIACWLSYLCSHREPHQLANTRNCRVLPAHDSLSTSNTLTFRLPTLLTQQGLFDSIVKRTQDNERQLDLTTAHISGSRITFHLNCLIAFEFRKPLCSITT